MITKRKQLLLTLLFSSILLLIFLYEKNTSWCSDFYTQVIIFKHKTDPNQQIEFQIQDCGAIGSNRRIVKIEKGYFFDKITPIDTSKLVKEDWIIVNEDMNELELKHP